MKEAEEKKSKSATPVTPVETKAEETPSPSKKSPVKDAEKDKSSSKGGTSRSSSRSSTKSKKK